MDKYLEITIDPDKFLLIAETLTRIGIPNKDRTSLYQSCHILHKRGKYYLMHFKEMFELDGKTSTMTEEDLGRRNTIAWLLKEWGLVDPADPAKIETPRVELQRIKIIPFSDKKNWTLVPKYDIGKRKK